MTQYSFFWGCGTDGDQGNVTLEKMLWMNMVLGNSNPDVGGIVYWNSSQVPPSFDAGVSFSNAADGLLAPSEPGGSVVRIASGIGMVQGSIYVSDDNTDFDISSDLGNASATDLIVLERTAADSTVRLARVKGAASSLATVTQTSALWQVAICQVVLTAGGDLSSIKDVRKICHSPAGSSVKIHESIGPFALPVTVDIPPIFSSVEIEFILRTDVALEGDLGSVEFNTAGNETIEQISTFTNLDETVTQSSAPSSDSTLGIVATGDNSPAGMVSSTTMKILGANSILDKTILYNAMGRAGSLNSGTSRVEAAMSWETSDPLTRIRLDSLFGANNAVEGSSMVIRGVI